MRNAIVLGAGMVGVSTALHLQKRGWSVALVDRKGQGLETSFGNAGIIQAEAVRPYPMPRDIATLLSIVRGTNNAVHYDARTLPQHANALLRYWWHSAPKRHRRISNAYASIINAAKAEHETLIIDAAAQHLVRRVGYRSLYRSARAMDLAVSAAETLHAEYGVAYRALTPAALGEAEPALLETGAGAVHWLDSWSVSDPGGLVGAYGSLFTRLGGTFAIGEAATARQLSGGGWRVDSDAGPLEAEHLVVALGPWSPELLHRFGYRVTMVRKRGYHRHYRPSRTLNVPLRDDAFSYAMAPMVSGLRITTGADLSGIKADRSRDMTGGSAAGDPIQLHRADLAARQLLDLGAPVENRPWEGTRPCMPDMLPVIGAAAKHQGLWMHFGHGHQGFTLGPATARLLAELMSGEKPFSDQAPFRPDR